ncbi:adenylate/guanylate cyclase domain-containing protein [Phyllobacterium sp. TAF24]|uniref:ATP-binding protein n=1 Tax=Phyllobacterium sp. TAF24 TaxID=3233068 RepID=UPI003F9BE53E
MASFEERPEGDDLEERRQVTVLFADIVDYTAIALRADPEDLRALLQRYYALVRHEIEVAGGIVAEYLADGVVAHFGIPQALQDAADRAVQAAVGIVSQAKEIDAQGHSLAVRVGLATGFVVAEYHGRTSKITGACGVLAARLQAAAEPDSVYLSDLTRRLLRRETNVHFVGDLSLKGFAKPQPTWRLTMGEAGMADMEAFPFVGRVAELRKLAAVWSRVVRTGRASPFHVLSGSPGIGKSRIVREHLTRCPAHQPKIVLAASERQRATALYPVVEWLRHDDRVAQTGEGMDYLRALLEPGAAADLLARETPSAIRQGTFDALAGAFRRIAQRMPIQVVAEDLQWMDHSSQMLIARLCADLSDCPIQWLGTCRTEFKDQFGEIRARIVSVAELNPPECHALLANCSDAINPDLAAKIIARSEGVPLFLEHLLRELKDGLIFGPDAVPETLVGALTAWIDRTGPARRVAQCASVIGSRSSIPLLAHLMEVVPGDVTEDVERLCRAEILHRDGDALLSFRHDLIREAAYGSLLRARRASLHRRVAKFLMAGDAHGNDKVMAEIAYHFEAAGDYAMAAHHRHRIGRLAVALGAFTEGETQLRRALDLLVKAGEGDTEATRQRTTILIDLAANLMQTRGFTDREVIETYKKSLSLLKTLDRIEGDSLAIFWGIFTYQVLMGRIKEAATTVARMETVLQGMPEKDRPGEHTLAVLGTRNGIQFYSGRFRAQLATLEKIRTCYDFKRDAPLAAKYGMDLFATAHAFAPHSAAITGQFALARHLITEADAYQMRLDVPLMLPYIHIWGAVALGYLGDFDQALARMQRGVALADHQGAAFWSATGRMWHAVIEFDAAGTPAIRAKMEQALDVQKAMGVGIGIPYWSAKLAAAYAVDGHDRQAQRLIAAAMTGSPGTMEGAWRAERQRLCGFVHECAGRADEARHFYKLAAQTARMQDAVLWETRARRAMVRLKHGDDTGDPRLAMLSAGIVQSNVEDASLQFLPSLR